MRTLYKAHLELRESVKLGDLTKEIYDWVIPRFSKGVDFDKFSEGVKIDENKKSLETIKTEEDGNELFGVALKHPDNKNPHLSWLTTLACGNHNEVPTVCVDLQGGFEDNTISPVNLKFFRPTFVPKILEKFGSTKRGATTNLCQIVGFDDIEEFTTQFIQSPKRRIPVVYVSRSIISERPLINVERTADFLSGIAHVVVGDTKYADLKLKDFMGSIHSCYDGAVRIYWPVRGEGLNSQFFSKKRISEYRNQIPEVLMKDVARLSVGMNMPLNFDLIKKSHLKKALKESSDKNDYVQIAETLMNENVALEKRLREAEEIITAQGEENRQLTFRVKNLSELVNTQKTAQKPEPEEKVDYHSVEEALRGFEERNSDSPLKFLPRAKKTAERCCFNDPNKVYGALNWIASTYVQAKKGKLRGINLEESAKNTIGMEFSPHQSDLTMGMWPEEYFVKYNGQKVKLKEHLKTGKKNPQSAIRIAFFYDKRNAQAVVGFVGYHQKNRYS